ncbi:MAG: carboxylating nicotinate-nucleotide diphosphorylase [Firmicutes bacterium]|nr:carboxylating nicotinate-nucleotide diphosphorylase [Bacillota bacterium]
MWERLVRWGLEEDIGHGDLTTASVIPKDAVGRLALVARQPMVVAGLPALYAAFRVLEGGTVTLLATDGTWISANTAVAWVSGRLESLLMAERVILNILQRLSGIATMTRRVVEQIDGLPTKVLDTRKTTPGWRDVEKYAVRMGGGVNHRAGLDGGVLLKDNHIAAVGSIRGAVERVRATLGPLVAIEVEIDRLDQLDDALAARPYAILLDNMSIDDLRIAVRAINHRAFVEASGNIRLDNVRAVAETGVDGVSLGWLTHSSPAVDIGADWGADGL